MNLRWAKDGLFCWACLTYNICSLCCWGSILIIVLLSSFCLWDLSILNRCYIKLNICDNPYIKYTEVYLTGTWYLWNWEAYIGIWWIFDFFCNLLEYVFSLIHFLIWLSGPWRVLFVGESRFLVLFVGLDDPCRIEFSCLGWLGSDGPLLFAFPFFWVNEVYKFLVGFTFPCYWVRLFSKLSFDL